MMNKNMITNFKLYEGKNIGLLYHFTTLYEAISIIDMDRLYSLAETRDKKGGYDRMRGVSMTRNKFLYLGEIWTDSICLLEKIENK